jgi:hypothetical protein
MKIHFKLDANDLNAALDVVSIVTPFPLDGKAGSGYLFVIRGNRCSLYSRDMQHVVKAELPIRDVEGEGAFIYPNEFAGAFKFFEGDYVDFDVDCNEAGVYSVKYSTGSGASAERTAIDPNQTKTCDADLLSAKDERSYPVAVLREGFAQMYPFLAGTKDQKSEDHFKTLQLFDNSKEEWAKGASTLYAANSVQAGYFESDAFEGLKGFAVHGQHLSQLGSFLAKATGVVTFKNGQNMTFVEDESGKAFGWTHHTKMHSKYSYYSFKADKYVLAVPRSEMLNALKYTRSEMDAKRDKIKLSWSNSDKTLRFEVVESNSKARSFPVTCAVVETQPEDFALNVNIDHLISLFSGVKGNEAVFRVALLPADPAHPKGRGMFRTIDEFFLDAAGKVVIADTAADKKPEGTFRCKVTRFMPSKE